MIRPLIFAGALTLAIGWLPPLAAADPFQIYPEIAAEINVTTDSAPGWMPTVDERQRAIETFKSYLDAIEGERYAEAYDLYAADGGAFNFGDAGFAGSEGARQLNQPVVGGARESG